MSDGGHVDAIRSAVAALNAGDIDGYLRPFAPSCRRWVPGFEQPRSVTDIRDDLDRLRAAFEVLRLDEDLLFGTERFVCARWRLRAIHVGEYIDAAPTRREISIQTCEVYEFDGELVVETWSYGDAGELFRQIGAASTEGNVQ